jgi:hypothetical protein
LQKYLSNNIVEICRLPDRPKAIKANGKSTSDTMFRLETFDLNNETPTTVAKAIVEKTMP